MPGFGTSEEETSRGSLPTVGCVVLAAGTSSRLGGPVPKQLLELDGRPLAQYALDAAAAAGLGPILLVLGLFTRPAALILTGTLLGAVYTTVVLRKDSQLALVYLVLVLSAAGLGPGPWSLDTLLFR